MPKPVFACGAARSRLSEDSGGLAMLDETALEAMRRRAAVRLDDLHERCEQVRYQQVAELAVLEYETASHGGFKVDSQTRETYIMVIRRFLLARDRAR